LRPRQLLAAQLDTRASSPSHRPRARERHSGRDDIAFYRTRSSFSPILVVRAHSDARDTMSSDDAGSDSDDYTTCPLETLLDPELTGVVTKSSVIALLEAQSASELARTSNLCTCAKTCKFRKYVDCDELWWPRCAAAWYEPGQAPACPGKAPKDKKSWKNAYLALKPEDGPSVEDVRRREAKVAKRLAMLEKWAEENKAGGGAMRGRALGGGEIVAPVGEDKDAMREFYKTVRSKPKGKSAQRSHAPVFGAD
jgi:hypothetical protein